MCTSAIKGANSGEWKKCCNHNASYKYYITYSCPGGVITTDCSCRVEIDGIECDSCVVCTMRDDGTGMGEGYNCGNIQEGIVSNVCGPIPAGQRQRGSMNPKGSFIPVKSSANNEFRSGTSDPGLGKNTIIYIVAGVGGFLVLLAGIFLLLRHRKKYHDRSRSSAEETVSFEKSVGKRREITDKGTRTLTPPNQHWQDPM